MADCWVYSEVNNVGRFYLLTDVYRKKGIFSSSAVSIDLYHCNTLCYVNASNLCMSSLVLYQST